MQLQAFRVTNFRSIVDTGWVPFSRDRVTVLVGQNESGKTSVLEALHCLLGEREVSEDDKRPDSDLPTMEWRGRLDEDDLASLHTGLCFEQAEVLTEYVRKNDSVFEFLLRWEPPVKGGSDYVAVLDFADEALVEALSEAWEDCVGRTAAEAAEAAAAAAADPSLVQPPKTPATELTRSLLASRLYQCGPDATLFNADTGLLPNRVDISEKFEPVGTSSAAAKNFLLIAEIDLKKLLAADTREREYVLNKANSRISADFAKFWTQTIGHENRLSIECRLENYPVSAGEKAGKAHLVFLIGDGLSKLYPRQRSQGVRWFVSFYLQLRATELTQKRRVFLLDEPGANLHPKAQEDVLRLINQLSKDIEIVYSTHSSWLVEYPKLYRVHAVQRDGDQDESPSVVIDAHRLGAASVDTLTPILSAMGTSLHGQGVVQRRGNVLLEEPSGFYYMHAFWKLVGETEPAHFIAASGASNVPTLASLFRGWGLEYVAVVDDDTRGRGVYKVNRPGF